MSHLWISWLRILPEQNTWPFWPLALLRYWIAQMWPYPDQSSYNFNKGISHATDQHWQRLYSAWQQVNRQQNGDGNRKDLPTGHIGCAPSNTKCTCTKHELRPHAVRCTHWASCPFATVAENWSSTDCPKKQFVSHFLVCDTAAMKTHCKSSRSIFGSQSTGTPYPRNCSGH
jgi:hypothetical protein